MDSTMQDTKKSKILFALLLATVLVFLSIGQAQANDKTMKIGILGPMKFEPGKHMWNGAELAAKEINGRGGVLIDGDVYRVEVIKGDSNEYLSVPDAVNALERLITYNKVNAVIGGARSEAILAQQEVMAERKIPYIMAGGGSPKLCEPVTSNYEKYKYFFRTSTPNSLYQVMTTSATIDMCAQEIRSELGIETPKVALLMEKAVWTDGMVKYAKAKLPEMGMEVVGVWRPSPNANDISAELSAIKSSEAQIIFTAFTGPVGVLFGKQMGDLEVPAAAVGVNVEAMTREYWESTGGKCEYQMIMNPVVRAEVTKRTIPAYDAYVKEYGDYPMYTAVGGYDGVYLLAWSAKWAGSLGSDALVEQLEKADHLGMAGRVQFLSKESKSVHDLRYGPRFSTLFGQQWRDKELKTVWPNGKQPKKMLGFQPGWEGLRFEGTIDYELPPIMVKYWKNK